MLGMILRPAPGGVWQLQCSEQKELSRNKELILQVVFFFAYINCLGHSTFNRYILCRHVSSHKQLRPEYSM